jgi:hypothetical protein
MWALGKKEATVDAAELKKAMEIETKELSKIFVGDIEPLVQILKAHLYTENFLEKIILATLVRGDKIVENGNFTYHNKLLICESADVISDSLVSSLRNLNKLRNKFAHQLDMQISEADITRIGSPFGKEFTKLKKEHIGNNPLLFSSVLVMICAKLAIISYMLEHDEE